MRVPVTSYASVRPPAEGFPAGLRVLVVDDDVTCLRILDHMLQRCRYRVTTCCQATVALSLLRERKGGYDMVISDVHMPDMDGFKLLEFVGLEMDLPVIMMSADGGTGTVMRGIKHGACDYLIKPVRMEELKNIWQHVIRKKWNGNRELEHSGEDSDHHHRMVDDGDIASSINNGGEGTWGSQKKKRDDRDDEDEGDLDNEDPSASKKPRVVWSVELHQQFVCAVNQLGIDKAVPKRILEMMNVPGLTRENIASHLQKFRLYLKRLSGVAQHHGAIPNSFCGSMELNSKAGQFDRLDFQASADSGQIPPQTLAVLQAEFLGRSSWDLVFPAVDKPGFLQASVQGPKSIATELGVVYGQPLLKCQLNISRQLPEGTFAVEDIASGFSMHSSNQLGTTGSNRRSNTSSTHNGSLLVEMLQQQQPYTLPVESSHAINVQPSCVVVSSPSNSFHMGNNPISLNVNTDEMPSRVSSGIQMGTHTVTMKQNSYCNSRNTFVNHNPIFSRSTDIPFDVTRVSVGNFNNVGTQDWYSFPGSLTSLSCCSPRTDSSTGRQIHSSTLSSGPASRLAGDLPNLCILGSESKTGSLPTQGQGRYHGYVGKGTCMPSRFAVDDIESPSNDLNHWKACGDGDRVKQEILLDFSYS